AGVIGFYGLIIPHIVRMIVGADNRTTMPLNVTLGGTFLLLIDNLSRTLSPQEIPISVFTLLIGAPIFIYIMRKYGTGWEV
ncbi:MAG: iron ABC transporter permease, partial [Chitinispirillaceae bacterium]|nr:iron ABC transporter permease [Chitinispirillaceae bacterium]